jgi:CRP-like cAMP-binding protein
MTPVRDSLDRDQPAGLAELPNPDSEREAVGSGPESWTAGDLTLVERHPMFEGVARETLEPLLRRCRIRELQVDEVLLRPDQVNRHLHLLLDGQLKVYLERLGSEAGFLIEPGECTGEISVIDCRPVTAFVAASRPSRLLLVPEQALWEDLLATPRIAKGFMRLFADRLRSELLIDQAIEDALRHVNLRLCSENPTWMFATLVVVLVNKRTGAVRYLNAGHDPILFGGEGLAYHPLPPPRGILVGVSEDAEYGAASLALRPNDVLVLYTDGMTEAMNPDHELFSSDRLLACLSERPAASAQELGVGVLF